MDFTEPTLDSWTSLFLLVAGQGFFLSFLLFSSVKNQERANGWLGALIFCFSFTLVDYVGYWTNYNHLFPALAGIYEPLVFLYGPLLYVYLRQLGKQEVAWRSIWPHFVPFLMVLVYRVPYIGLAREEKLKILKGDLDNLSDVFLFPYDFSVFLGLCIIHLAIYSFLIYGVWMRQQLSNTSDTNARIIRNQWYKLLWQLYTAFVVSYFTYFMLVRTQFFTRTQDYIIAISMSVFIYAIGFLGYRKPQIFKGGMLERVFIPRKYRHSSLTNAAARSLQRKLLVHMETTKPYLENGFRLNELAEQLSVSSHHLSQVINEQLNKNFSDFVNTYRVEEAKDLLLDPAFKDKYIIDIAYAAGFNNKTTFNKAFKEQTGMSPSAFRKQQSGNAPRATI